MYSSLDDIPEEIFDAWIEEIEKMHFPCEFCGADVAPDDAYECHAPPSMEGTYAFFYCSKECAEKDAEKRGFTMDFRRPDVFEANFLAPEDLPEMVAMRCNWCIAGYSSRITVHATMPSGDIKTYYFCTLKCFDEFCKYFHLVPTATDREDVFTLVHEKYASREALENHEEPLL